MEISSIMHDTWNLKDQKLSEDELQFHPPENYIVDNVRMHFLQF